jgi:hypothetical protein
MQLNCEFSKIISPTSLDGSDSPSPLLLAAPKQVPYPEEKASTRALRTVIDSTIENG